MQFLDERLPSWFWRLCIPEPNTGCWLWIGGTNKKGYGLVNSDKGTRSAHRYSYMKLMGSLPQELHIDHRVCRTPACVNPAHLEAVTPFENWRRGNAPSAVAVREARCTKGHEFTPSNTLLRFEGERLKQRVCRACRVEHKKTEHANRRRRRAERRASNG